MQPLIPVEEALDRIAPGARIVATPGCAAPTTLLAGLARLARTREGLHLYTGLQLEDQPFLAAVAEGRMRFSTWHVTPASRPLIAQGLADHLPLRLSDVPPALEHLAIDVALIRVSPPDADGTVSLGPSMSYSRAAVETADLVIAEVDPSLPRTSGPTLLHTDRIDALVASERPTPVHHSREPDEDALRIADHLTELLPESPTLQLGIGQVPEAIADTLLRDRVASLRFVGLAIDRMVDLAETGLLDGTPREVPPIAAVEVIGSERLMRFVDDNPLVGVYPSTQGHDPGWLADHFPRIVSVNSALEIDLLGQVNAEMIGGTQVSGVGGSADFVDAARASQGGLSIIALPSTTKAGTVSRIVERLGSDAVTTVPRHAYHVVITEHGVADLRGLNVRERAHALSDLAAPTHRPRLERAQGPG